MIYIYFLLNILECYNFKPSSRMIDSMHKIHSSNQLWEQGFIMPLGLCHVIKFILFWKINPWTTLLLSKPENCMLCKKKKNEHKRSLHMIRRHLLRIWFPVRQANSIAWHCKSCLIRNIIKGCIIVSISSTIIRKTLFFT